MALSLKGRRFVHDHIRSALRGRLAALKGDDDLDLRDGPEPASRPARENLESLARFAGLLAGAEVAAITLCRGDGLIVELTDPPAPWLAPGAFMRAQPCERG